MEEKTWLGLTSIFIEASKIEPFLQIINCWEFHQSVIHENGLLWTILWKFTWILGSMWSWNYFFIKIDINYLMN